MQIGSAVLSGLMTNDQVDAACRKYAQRLDTMHQALPERNASADSLEGKVNHLRWMCDQIPSMLCENEAKAMRWLGFLQGYLNCLGVFTIDELKEDNR